MFYVGNVHRWLEEVIDACNDNGFDPKDSIFSLVFFSSLDDDLLAFFRDRRKQISSYSGMNVHIFSPIIYEDVVPDGEWRLLRDQFINEGIRLGSEPAAIFFRLEDGHAAGHGKSWSSYRPDYFAAHHLPHGQEPTRTVRDIVETCIKFRPSTERLRTELAKVLRTPNVIVHHFRTELAAHIAETLDQPRIFLSHASRDKAVVRQFAEGLRNAGTRPWLDELELEAGDQLRDELARALKRADVILVFLSEAAAQSSWLQHEVALFSGQDERRRIIPVVIDDFGRELASRLPATQGLLYLEAKTDADRAIAIHKIIKAARAARDA